MYAYIKNGVIDCVSMELLEIPNTKTIKYDDSISIPVYSNWNIFEYVDTSEEKKTIIYNSLISNEDISTVDIGWIIFNDREIGDIIVDRVFWWNPHWQTALLAKASAYMLSVVSGTPNTELLAEVQSKQAEINEVRAKFNLQPL